MFNYFSESLSWFNLMQCVSAELFPGMSVKISEAVQEKLLKDTAFKMSDIGKEAADDIIQRLMAKRTMKIVEINYLEGLFERGRQYESGHNGMLFTIVYLLMFFNFYLNDIDMWEHE